VRPVPLVDTHTHLCSREFDGDRDQVIERAKAAGVRGIIAVGETLKDAEKNLSLSKQYSLLHPAAGLYPTILDIAQARRLHEFILAHPSELTAIGEVGLDYWKVKGEDDREIQREIFRHFIRLSKQLDLPLNVHSRSAGRHALSLLLEENAKKVQLHAFDGKAATALKGVEAGFFFSIPTSIVRSRQKQKLVRRLPLSALLVETDSPVLGDDPGTRNEPANVVQSVRTIAEIKGIPAEEAAEAILENTRRLYGSRIDIS